MTDLNHQWTCLEEDSSCLRAEIQELKTDIRPLTLVIHRAQHMLGLDVSHMPMFPRSLAHLLTRSPFSPSPQSHGTVPHSFFKTHFPPLSSRFLILASPWLVAFGHEGSTEPGFDPARRHGTHFQLCHTDATQWVRLDLVAPLGPSGHSRRDPAPSSSPFWTPPIPRSNQTRTALRSPAFDLLNMPPPPLHLPSPFITSSVNAEHQ